MGAAQDSPDQTALLAAFDFGELEGAANQVLFGFITKGKACWNDVKQDVRDAYMRDTMYAALGAGRAEKLWHVHHEAIDVNGRLGESLEETHMPFNLARCTLRSGVTAEDILQGKSEINLQVPNQWLPRDDPLEVTFCRAADIDGTSFFRSKGWTHEAPDGKFRLCLYFTGFYDVTYDQMSERNLAAFMGYAASNLKGAFKAADPDVYSEENKVKVQSLRMLYDSKGIHTQWVAIVSCDKGYGNLPTKFDFPTGGVTAEKTPVVHAVDISYAFIGKDRHRCYKRNGVRPVPVITAKHQPCADCKYAGNRFQGKRGTSGSGAKQRREAERAASGAFTTGKGGSNGVGPGDSVEMATGEHERRGQVRGGGTKRAASPSPSKQRVRPK